MSFKITNRFILLVVLLVGTILRFWNYTLIPFSHDEFSALFRLDYSSFGELIDKGVRPDGHPAGVQVFLYYWTNIFGDSEWIVKLPFTIAGVLSIWLLYRLGSLWFNSTVGLISASFLAALQYPIVYSVTARPYISGLFLTLCLSWFWSQLFFRNNWHWKHVVGFIVFAALCAYNHHFSLLFAAIVALSGLFTIRRQSLVKYLVACSVSIVLYLPHLPIFFEQLSRGGIEGWLAKPDPLWLLTYVRYIFHYSWLLLALLLLLVIYGIFKRERHYRSTKKYLILCVWFVSPYLIGYFYSVYFNAVLQYSVLIFSFPYLFFLLFGHYKLLKPKQNLFLVCIVLLVCVITLTVNRKHFEVLYASNYQHVVSDIKLAKDQNVSTFLVSTNHKMSAYYKEKLDLPYSYINIDTFNSQGSFEAFVRQLSVTDTLVYLGGWSSMNPNYLSIVSHYFPSIEEERHYLGGSTYVLSKNEPKIRGYSDSILGVFELDSSTQWSPGMDIDLCKVLKHRNDALVLSVEVKNTAKNQQNSLVSVVQSEEDILHWSEMELDNCIADSNDLWHKIYHTIQFSNISLQHGTVLKTFVWKKAPHSSTVRNLKVEYQPGNRVVYGLRDEF